MSRIRMVYAIVAASRISGVQYNQVMEWSWGDRKEKLLYRTSVEFSGGTKRLLVIGFEISSPYKDKEWGEVVEVELPTPTEEVEIENFFKATFNGIPVEFYH